MTLEKLGFLYDLLRNDRPEGRVVLMEKSGEAIEVGKGVLRPFELHVPRQGRKACVPQVSSQRTTFSFGTVRATLLDLFPAPFELGKLVAECRFRFRDPRPPAPPPAPTQ